MPKSYVFDSSSTNNDKLFTKSVISVELSKKISAMIDSKKVLIFFNCLSDLVTFKSAGMLIFSNIPVKLST